MKHISSTQNTVIKDCILLQSKGKKRTKKKQFVVEGSRELRLAHLAHYTISTLFWCPEIFAKQDFASLIKTFNNQINVISVSLVVYQID